MTPMITMFPVGSMRHISIILLAFLAARVQWELTEDEAHEPAHEIKDAAD